MADEYISREAAKAILKRYEHRFTCADEVDGFGEVKWSEYVIYADTAQNCIDKVPAADVAPVVHAHWGRGSEDDKYQCSHCGIYEHEGNYCGFCGAKMDERSEDDG